MKFVIFRDLEEILIEDRRKAQTVVTRISLREAEDISTILEDAINDDDEFLQTIE
jgi:hypothetical protein